MRAIQSQCSNRPACGASRIKAATAQKEQLRDDFRELRRAHQNHERFATMRAARSIRTVLESGALSPRTDRELNRTCRPSKKHVRVRATAWEWDRAGFGSFLIDKRMAACRSVVEPDLAHRARRAIL